ncbi:hypothetical protein M2302_002904 [Micromonospora sp. A200]|uniref:hypothetical protein n=1 Tax=Micromonospora sp. A200 TaxID=2940568 RepID=UPI002477037B|nr:hypothetical protein [Micromonospora sp. A200]MDH6462724.1 hypothetical protein [Micromonospora sp. A200]
MGARYSGDRTFAAADAGPGATEVVVPAGTTRFVGLQPARILDTRPDRLSGCAGGKPAAGATITLQVTGRGGVPATGATAVALNVTAVVPAAGGYVTVWPADQPRPMASNLNIETAGQVIPNLVVVPLSGTGRVNLYTKSSLHLAADVAEYRRVDRHGGPARPAEPGPAAQPPAIDCWVVENMAACSKRKSMRLPTTSES